MNIPQGPRAKNSSAAKRFQGNMNAHYCTGSNRVRRANHPDGDAGPSNNRYPEAAPNTTGEKWHLAYDTTEIQIPVRKGNGYVMKTVPRSEAPEQHLEVMRMCYPEVYGKSSFEVLVNTTDLKKNGSRIPEREQLNAVYNDQAWPIPAAVIDYPGGQFSPRMPVLATAVTGVLNPEAPIFTVRATSMNNSGGNGSIDTIASNQAPHGNRETTSLAVAVSTDTPNDSRIAFVEPLFESSNENGNDLSDRYIAYDSTDTETDDSSCSSVCEFRTADELEDGETGNMSCHVCGVIVSDDIDAIHSAPVGIELYHASGHNLRAAKAAEFRMIAAGKRFPVTLGAFTFRGSHSVSCFGEEAREEEYISQDLAALGVNLEVMVDNLVTFAGEWDCIHMLSEEVQGYGHRD